MAGAKISQNKMKNWFILILAPFFLFYPASSQAENRAGVVVVHSDGQIKHRCVSFEEPSISGYLLLEKAGFAPQQDRGFVIEIDGEKTKSAWEISAGDRYWSYWKLKDSKWIYSLVGALTSQVGAGQIDGWKISPSDTNLPLLSFEEICSFQNTKDSTPPSAVDSSSKVAAVQIETPPLAVSTASTLGISKAKLSSPKEGEKKQVKGAVEEKNISTAAWLSNIFNGPLNLKKVLLVLGFIFLFNFFIFGAFALLKNRHKTG
jgi:hypothetical protein